jgi:DNA-binding transcriptional ArsR family regulator
MRLSDEALGLVATRFRALGDPMRLRILRLLEGGEMSVGRIVDQLETSQANISKHLKVLLDAGVLSRRVQGTSAYYSIGDPVVLRICDTICHGLTDNLRAQAESLGFKLEPQRPRRVKR